LVLEIVRGIVTSPTVSPLISEGVLDLDKLLDIAAIPKGKDIAGALERVKALAAAMSQPGGMISPSTTPPTQMAAVKQAPIIDTWPDAAKELADRIAAGRARLAETLGGSQDWGAL
jgi:hypothetical protein